MKPSNVLRCRCADVSAGVRWRLAAPVSTFSTSIVGVTTCALPALTALGPAAPDWTLGIACGLGGLIGILATGYLLES